MKPKITMTALSAVVACLLLGYGCNETKPVAKPDAALVAERDSLAFSVKNLQAEVLMQANEIAELKARKPEVVEKVIHDPADAVEIGRLTAELQKARQRPEALPQACAEVPRFSAAVPSVAPQVYQPRFRLFRGRR